MASHAFETRRAPDAAFIDTLLAALSDQRSRYACYYLLNHGGIAGVGEVAQRTKAQSSTDPAALVNALDRTVLPELAELGLVRYDRDSGQILYRGGSLTTELLEWIKARELEID